MTSQLKSRLSENLSYKIVALFVTLVLWLTMLSRKDSVLTRELPVQYITSQSHNLANEPKKRARVKVSGSRSALKKFAQSDEGITIDLSRMSAGRHLVRLNQESLNLPLGVKVLSIEPDEIEATIKENK